MKDDNSLLWTILGLAALGVGVFCSVECCSALEESSTIIKPSDTGGTSTDITANPGDASSMLSVVGGIGSTATSSAADENPVIVIVERAGGSDRVPYEVAEKRANRLYKAINHNEDELLSAPVVMATSAKDREILQDSFDLMNKEAFLEKIAIWEKLLEDIKS